MKNLKLSRMMFLTATALLFGTSAARADGGISAPQYNGAPGANLQCVCRGGPGNYTYSCPPVLTTCYGGPSGSYPFQCMVCPQPQ